MYTANLRKVGGSVMLAVPPAILEMLRMESGSSVSMAVESGRLIIEPNVRKKYSLQELLAQCDASAPLSPEDGVWSHGRGADLMRRGDIYLVTLDPTEGHEQQGTRPVLVISPDEFNRVTQVPVVLPITSGGNFARTAGFAVSLSGCGTRTTGVVRCDQPRALDLRARSGRRLEQVPPVIMDEVLARLATIFS